MNKLLNVCIETESLDKTLDVFQAICGVQPEQDTTGLARFPLQDASLLVGPVMSTSKGLTSISVSASDLATRLQALTEHDVDARSSAAGIEIEPDAANGLRVMITEALALESRVEAGARLDHVALRVRDLVDASARWSAITGVEAQQMGLHPVSGGAFNAARIVLDERMIELLAPVPGMDSDIAARLDSHGEGVSALALPVDELEEVRKQLAAIGARVIYRDPHWMVHPGDAGGVLVQLTPRVAH